VTHPANQAMTVSRRNFLKGAAAGTAGTALTAGVLIGGARADAGPGGPPETARSYPFHGPHQAGVLTPGPAGKQAAACFAAFDVLAGGPAGLPS
jgi:deferrochelatase/peroxidase EfeB